MTFKVVFTPEVDDALRAHEAVEAFRTVAKRHLSTTPYGDRRVGQRPLVLVIGVRHQREEAFH